VLPTKYYEDDQIKGVKYDMHKEMISNALNILVESLKGREHSEATGIYGRIILKRMLGEKSEMVCI
jgi:hypothetical protein